MSYLVGSGLTSYGKHEGSSTLDLMSQASNLALKDAGLSRADIDGVICGYCSLWRCTSNTRYRW
jgi:3-oxoacyl-[acyl-carrier-protein] synthase III